uniref:Uncharacterized protein n=1 Tax=Siphoviridae sp. ctQtc11 TaxID=2825497 RepID=A0A8S5P4T3_9CAUD|nr:MAG TPA: hypothetical protein [Siphoviridae sp. ctQtc11]
MLFIFVLFLKFSIIYLSILVISKYIKKVR